MNSLFHYPTRLLPIVIALGIFILSNVKADAEPIVRVDFGDVRLVEENFVPAFSQFNDNLRRATETLSLAGELGNNAD